jgi:hypothetical protein
VRVGHRDAPITASSEPSFSSRSCLADAGQGSALRPGLSVPAPAGPARSGMAEPAHAGSDVSSGTYKRNRLRL